MGKYDLELSSKRHIDVIEPEVLAPASMVSKKKTDSEFAKEALTGSIEIAKMAVSTGCDIARIKANADAEVKRISAEIDKIYADTKSYINRIQTENETWHSQFDKVVQFVTSQLDRHPEWSDAIKLKVFDFATSIFNKK